MLLLAAAIAALAPPPEPPAATRGDDIVVIADRMRRIRLDSRTDRKTGERRCVIRRTSGDSAFDRMMCDAVLACAPRVTTGAEMESCLAPSLEGYARKLAGPPDDAEPAAAR